MLPARIVGTVLLPGGDQPFLLDTASGRVTVGHFAEPDPSAPEMAADAVEAAERQVREKVASAREVRIGAFRCPSCRGWIDVARHPESWAGQRCTGCG